LAFDDGSRLRSLVLAAAALSSTAAPVAVTFVEERNKVGGGSYAISGGEGDVDGSLRRAFSNPEDRPAVAPETADPPLELQQQPVAKRPESRQVKVLLLA